MKDFRLDRKADPKYILEVKEGKPVVDGMNQQETILVKFAGGQEFVEIAYVPENLEKLIKQQEEQAKTGVENISVFKNRKTRAGAILAAEGLSSAALATSAAFGLLATPVIAVIAAGVIAVSSIPTAYSLIKNSGKVTELSKIKYRDENRAVLGTYSQYRNSLSGLSSDKVKYFRDMTKSGQDAFSIVQIDNFTEEDLHRIKENIDIEETYGFTYVKKPSSSKK